MDEEEEVEDEEVKKKRTKSVKNVFDTISIMNMGEMELIYPCWLLPSWTPFCALFLINSTKAMHATCYISKFKSRIRFTSPLDVQRAHVYMCVWYRYAC